MKASVAKRINMKWAGGVVVAMLVSLAVQAESSLISDDFEGTELNTNLWKVASTPQGVDPTVDGEGNLFANVSGASGSQRSVIISQRHDLDFFATPLTVNLGGVLMDGDPGSGALTSFVVLGRANDDVDANYSSGFTTYEGAVVFRLQQKSTGWELFFANYVDQTQHNSVTYNLNQAPTDIQIVVDGANKAYDIELVGAQFSASSTNTQSGTWTELNATHMTVGDDVFSRLAIGAINGGPVTTGTKLSLDSVEVIPEPATFGMLGLGAALILLIRRFRS